VNDRPVQCHFLAVIPALMTIVAARNAFASLPADGGVLGILRELAAPRLDLCQPVDLVELEEQL
jgi:hypothetical protein